MFLWLHAFQLFYFVGINEIYACPVFRELYFINPHVEQAKFFFIILFWAETSLFLIPAYCYNGSSLKSA